MKIIGILVAITCLPMGDAAQAACPTLAADAYQIQRDARARDTTPEQLEIMQIGGCLRGRMRASNRRRGVGLSRMEPEPDRRSGAPHGRAASYLSMKRLLQWRTYCEQ